MILCFEEPPPGTPMGDDPNPFYRTMQAARDLLDIAGIEDVQKVNIAWGARGLREIAVEEAIREQQEAVGA